MNLKDFHNYFIISAGILFEIILLVSNTYLLAILLIDSFKPIKGKLKEILRQQNKISMKNPSTHVQTLASSTIMVGSRDQNQVSELKEEITSKQVNNASIAVARTSATNAFLISLCISDLMIGVLVLPIFIFTKSKHTFWTIELCRIYRFFKYFSILSNTLSNVAIALERFRLVVFKSKYSFKLIMINILAFYLFSFGIAFVEIRHLKLKEVNNTRMQLFGAQILCMHSNNITLFERVTYASLYIIFGSILPLAMLIIFYLMILRSLSRLAQSQADAVNAKRNKLKRSFLEILLIMIFSHFPHGILSLVEYFVDSSSDPILLFIVDVTFILTTSHAFFILYPYRYLYPRATRKRSLNKIQPNQLSTQPLTAY